MEKKQKVHYVNNKQLYAELVGYNETGVISEKLHLMLYQMASKISNKTNWNQYSWRDDMISNAYLKCLEIVQKFDINRTNPFTYFTTVIHNYFADFLKYEKVQKNIKQKNKILLDGEMYFRYGIMPLNTDIIDYDGGHD